MHERGVVMIHGAGAGGWQWRVWQARFAARGRSVVAPDLRAVGAGLAATRFEDYQAQIENIARAAPAPVVLIGASLGGLLAARVASRAPCAALVLINPMPAAPWHADAPTRAPYPEIKPWGRDASHESTRRALPDSDEATWDFAWRRWRDESGAVLNAARGGLSVERPSCPVLFVLGEDDADAPAAINARWAGEWMASVLRWRGVSHVGPLLGRKAVVIADAVLAWLEGLD